MATLSTANQNVNNVDFKKKEQIKRPFDDPIDRSDVEIVVERSMGKNVKILNHHVRTFSVEKVGFMGAHRRLVVTIQRQNSPDKEVMTYFLKHMPRDIEQQAIFMEESRIFFKEVQFFRQILPELLQGLKDKSWFGKCFLVKDDALVFEDLQSRNFAVKGKILSLEALKGASASLAKMHAASILAERRMDKTFLELYPEVLKECVFARDSGFIDFIKTGINVAVAVAKSLGLETKNVAEAVECIFWGLSASKTYRNVVLHGDAWANNIMMNDEKPIPKAILVDFQLVRYAPATTDLLQMLYSTTRRKFREEHETELLRYYHSKLCEALRENDAKIETPTCDDIKREYEDLRAVGVVTAAINFPANIVDGKLCAELTKDSDGFESFMFRERVDLVFGIMKKDAIYRERINEAITELVERAEDMLSKVRK